MRGSDNLLKVAGRGEGRRGEGVNNGITVKGRKESPGSMSTKGLVV